MIRSNSDGLCDAVSYAFQDMKIDMMLTVALKHLPDKVLFNKKKEATTMLSYNAGKLNKKPKVTVVKTCKGDKFDKKYGFLLAYFQHYSGLSKTQANKYLKKVVEE